MNGNVRYDENMIENFTYEKNDIYVRNRRKVKFIPN